MSNAILALWAVVIVLRICALAAIVRRGLGARYPVLTAALGIGSIRSLALAASLVAGGQAAYLARWSSSQTLVLALTAAMLLECYVVQARSSQRFLGPGAALLVVLLGAAAVVVAASVGMLPPTAAALPPVLFLWRHFNLGAIVLLVAGRWFFAGFSRQPANSGRYCWGMVLLLGSEEIAVLLAGPNWYWTNALAQFVLLGTGGMVYLSWSLLLDRAGQEVEPLERMEEAEYRESEREWYTLARSIREAAAERLRRFFWGLV